MVSPTAAASSSSFASSHSSSTSSWRSQGWRPLTYPVFHSLLETSESSSFFDSNPNKTSNKKMNLQINYFFPLHKDVLLAALRELILLQYGTSSNLQQRKSKKNEREMNHSGDIKFKSFQEDPEDCLKFCETRAYEMLQICQDTILNRWNIHRQEKKNPIERTMLSTLERATTVTVSSAWTTTPTNMDHTCTTSSSIRKVSNAEEEEEEKDDDDHEKDGKDPLASSILSSQRHYDYYPSPHCAILAQDPKGREIIRQSGLFLLSHPDPRNHENHIPNIDVDEKETFLQLYSTFPPFVNMSINMEEYMKQVVHDMISPMIEQHFSLQALKEFFGYKSNPISQHVLLDMMTNLLFDVSHALFAWHQTESEWNIHHPVLSKTSLTCANSDDQIICNHLFDDRALKKMGGFGPSSLLFHSLTIGRQRNQGGSESWSSLYGTDLGKALFAHHLNYDSILNAGLLRRKKRRKTCIIHDPNGEEVQDPKQKRRRMHSPITYVEPIIPSFPSENIVRFTITRSADEKWGIALVKDGNHCVVERVSRSSVLQPGDRIVKATNENGEQFGVNDVFSIMNDGFFEIITLFKKSLLLHLEVKRPMGYWTVS